MREMSAVTDGIRGYGACATAMAAEVREAEATAATTGVGPLTPVFGLIGGDFLAAFAAAHGAHTAALGALAGTLERTGAAAVATAAAYDCADRAGADAVDSAGAGAEVRS